MSLEEILNSELILERYEPLQKLGEGARAIVVEARDRLLDKPVALKILKDDLSERQARRIHREAKASGKLKHFNILTILDFGVTEKNQPYLVMDIVKGKSLQDLIDDIGPLPVENALDVFNQICSGMEHAHEKGVIHRDLKPSNVMMVETVDSEFTTARIVDFGLALLKEKDEKITQSGQSVGSPLFMAPEQADGKNADERSDIYSMGCLMHTTLTGTPPFEGDSALNTVMLHKTEKPPSLSEKTGRDFADEVEQLVSRCIEKEPDSRFPSFSALRTAISSAEASISADTEKPKLESPPVSSQDQASDNNSPYRTRVALAIVAGIAAAILIAVNLPSGNPVAEQSREDLAGLGALPPEAEWPVLKIKKDERGQVKTVQVMGVMSDDDLKRLAEHPRLQNLEAIDQLSFQSELCDISGTGFSSFQELPVRVLFLGKMALTDEGLAHIARVKGLQTLYLNDCDRLSTDSLKYLAGCDNLEFLIVSGKNITSDSLAYLSQLKSLKNVQLEKMKIDEAGAKNLNKIGLLESIVVTKCKFTAAAFKELARNEKLDNYSFHECLFGETELRELSKLPAHVLTFRHCNFPQTWRTWLVQNKHLNLLTLDDCGGVTASELRALVDQRPAVKAQFKPRKRVTTGARKHYWQGTLEHFVNLDKSDKFEKSEQ